MAVPHNVAHFALIRVVYADLGPIRALPASVACSNMWKCRHLHQDTSVAALVHFSVALG